MDYFRFLVPIIFIICWFYLRKVLHKRVTKPLKLSKVPSIIIELLVLFVLFFRYTYKLQWDSFAQPTAMKFFYVVFFSMGLLFYGFILSLLLDVYEKVNKKEQLASNPDRRDFLKFVGISTIAGGTAIGGAIQAQNVEVEKVDIKHKKLPKELDDLKIAQISDIHIGPTINKDHLNNCVDLMMENNPDLIVITGDTVDGTPELLKDHFHSLKKLSAPLGIYFVTGNHEYYWDAESWINFYQEKYDIPCLLNDGVIIKHNGSSFGLAGVTDYKAQKYIVSHASSPIKAIEKVKETPFKILLAHRPRSCFEAYKAGFDLQLSGHTHGGQSFPFNFVIALVQPYVKGLNWHKEMAVYVSKGAGYWGPPIRLGVAPSIDILTLKSV